MVSVLLGCIAGLVVVLAFVGGSIYGKGITINKQEQSKVEHINEPNKEQGYLVQPKVADQEIEEYMKEHNGIIKF